jgi:hypothetical protein
MVDDVIKCVMIDAMCCCEVDECGACGCVWIDGWMEMKVVSGRDDEGWGNRFK